MQDYGAHIFSAPLALNYGFIDVAGVNIHDALTELLKNVGIEDDNYQFIRLSNKEWWKSLFSAQSSMLTGKVKHEMSLSPAFDLLMQNKYLYLYYPQ